MHNTQIKRIVKSKQFSNVKKNGNKLVYKPFVILYTKDESLDLVKIGFIASSKIGNAVVRNKIKRRLKNVAMSVLSNIDAHGFSICVIARNAAYDYNFDKMKGLFTNAIKKITSTSL